MNKKSTSKKRPVVARKVQPVVRLPYSRRQTIGLLKKIAGGVAFSQCVLIAVAASAAYHIERAVK